MEKIVTSTNETKELAGRVATQLESGDVLALYGDLGTGKTTFTSFLVDALGIEAKVQSPSFVLARVYEESESSKKGKRKNSIQRVNHLDLYRLKSPENVEDLDLEGYFSQENSITVIEWPQVAEKILPLKTLKIFFEDLGGNNRKIYFK